MYIQYRTHSVTCTCILQPQYYYTLRTNVKILIPALGYTFETFCSGHHYKHSSPID